MALEDANPLVLLVVLSQKLVLAVLMELVLVALMMQIVSGVKILQLVKRPMLLAEEAHLTTTLQVALVKCT